MSGVRTLLGLSKSDVDTIVTALSRIPASASTKRLSASVGSSLGEFTSEQLYEAMRALRSLYGAYSGSDTPLREFVKELLPSIQDLLAVRLSPTKRKEISLRLERLLGVEEVALYAGMRNLATAGEGSFCKARINTDLRPVFINGESKPKGFMLIHRLQLGFHQGEGEHKDFYVTLDDEDLGSLREAIDQAEKKARGLQATIAHLEG